MRSTKILVAGSVSCLVLVSALMAAMLLGQAFGKPVLDSGDAILKTAVDSTGAANIVCSVVLDIRGYDTLGEATLLLTAVTGVAVMLGKRGSK
ncbi:MAG: hydrogen gas-evolving membrane-bound hydrogenase subunit E [Candidatus Micrarchaeota archaeon]